MASSSPAAPSSSGTRKRTEKSSAASTNERAAPRKPVPNLRNAALGHLGSGQVDAEQANFVARVLSEAVAPQPGRIEPWALTASLLGEPRTLWPVAPTKRADIHAALVHGLPGTALRTLVDGMDAIGLAELAPAVGVSERTLRRYLESAESPLPVDVGSRVWSFAQMLAKAIDALGDRPAAEQWMLSEAMGLDRQRPIDLMVTEPGRLLVDEFLDRIVYGVYN